MGNVVTNLLNTFHRRQEVVDVDLQGFAQVSEPLHTLLGINADVARELPDVLVILLLDMAVVILHAGSDPSHLDFHLITPVLGIPVDEL